MKTILIADINKRLLEDIESRAFIQDYDNVNICTTDLVDDLQEEILSYGAQELVVSAGILQSHPSWDFGIPVRCYAADAKEASLASSYQIPCMGIMDKSDMILDAVVHGQSTQAAKTYQGARDGIEDRISSRQQDRPANPQVQPRADGMPDRRQTWDKYPEKQECPDREPVRTQEPSARNHAQNYQQGAVQQGYRQDQVYMDPPSKMVSPSQQAYFQPQNTQGGWRGNQHADGETAGGQGGYYQDGSVGQQQWGHQQEPPYPYYRQPSQPNAYQTGWDAQGSGRNNPYWEGQGIPQEGPGQYYQQPSQVGGQGQPYRMDGNYIPPSPGFTGNGGYSQESYMAVEHDMGNIRPATKAITVYSAKGGVGKTTIACELATYLALTRHGKENFKVCIADFNIDFGDVVATLPFDPGKVNMSLWASDIRDRIASGEDPGNIWYTEREIKDKWLQRNERDGLYALIAPLTNEDSYEIGETEQQVMLDNLVRNGGFDYVIFDTGNNTRDSSFIAVTSADVILLVVTQNVATANSNAGVLNTFGSLGVDLNKVRLVINQVKPAKQVSVSAFELEEVFVNPNTQQPYPCVAQIKDSNDVINAGNIREPLVYKAAHEYTRCIGQIASGLIGETFTLEKPQRKKLFQFRRKGGN